MKGWREPSRPHHRVPKQRCCKAFERWRHRRILLRFPKKYFVYLRCSHCERCILVPHAIKSIWNSAEKRITNLTCMHALHCTAPKDTAYLKSGTKFLKLNSENLNPDRRVVVRVDCKHNIWRVWWFSSFISMSTIYAKKLRRVRALPRREDGRSSSHIVCSFKAVWNQKGTKRVTINTSKRGNSHCDCFGMPLILVSPSD